VFRHYIVFEQYEKASLEAWDAIEAWDGSASEARKIYERFSMDRADVLNITGEGVTGGPAAIQSFRIAVESLGDEAPPRDLFAPITRSLAIIFMDLFRGNGGLGFVASDAFKRITTPPSDRVRRR
jgi:hypothetical protein